VTTRSITMDKSISRLAPALRRTAFSAVLALAGGCQSEGELANTKNGIGGALAPLSVQQYAKQRGISDQQARQELQQKVGEHDEEQAVRNIDEVGAKQGLGG
jgi:hypothetical protein